MKKKSFFGKSLCIIYKRNHFPPNSLVYIFIRILGENEVPFPSLNIFDAFELDVNVVNFVYYGKTRLRFRP